MSKLFLNFNAKQKQSDLRKSRKLYNSAVKNDIKTLLDAEAVEAVVALVQRDIDMSAENAAALTNKLPLEVRFLSTHERKKYDISGFDGKTRGLIHSLNRLEERVYSLQTMIESGLHSKRFSARLATIITSLYKAQIESKEGKVPLNAVLPQMVNTLGNEMIYGKEFYDLSNNSFNYKEVIIVNFLSTLASTRMLKMELMTSSLGGKSFMLHLNFEVPAATLRALRATRKRSSLLACPEELEGEDHFLISGRSWKYDQPKFTEEVLESINILNGTPLSLKKCSAEEFSDAMAAKFKVPGFTGKDVWYERAYDNAVEEFNEILENDNTFYVKHFFDRVGRTYEDSEYFGVQQNTQSRALVELANKKVLNEAGREAVRLDIACKAGYDKATKEEALAAFNAHSESWRENGKFEYEFSVLESNEPTGYIIYQDATNSGTQMYTIASASKELATICGLVDGERKDAYGLLAMSLNDKLGIEGFTRKNSKSLFMTVLYNAGKQLLLYGHNGANDGELKLLNKVEAVTNGKMTPLMMTAKGMDPDTVWDAFYESMWEIAPEAMKLMAYIGQHIDDETLNYTWTMDDGMVAQCAMYQTVEKHITWCDNDARRHTMTFHEKELQPKAKRAALAPGIVQAMDAYALRTLVRKAALAFIDVVTVHDSFGTHPNDTAEVRGLYRGTLAEMLESNMFSRILQQLKPEGAVDYQSNGTLTGDDVRNSTYALWA